MKKKEQKLDLTDTISFEKIRIEKGGPGDRKAILTIIHGRGAILGQSVVVEEETVAGRDPGCDLVLIDPGVSRHHLRVKRDEGGGHILEDLGSTNGTVLNDRPAGGPEPLREGDKIFVGDTVLRFSMADEMDVGFQQRVARMLATDPLTGLESKRSFDDRLAAVLETARDSEKTLAILMMDLDGIKGINDTHGHLYGAHCIRTAGVIIGKVIERSGHACRFGGDEFTVFLPFQTKTSALETAERIRSAVDEAGMEKDGVALHPTISIGVAVYPEDGIDIAELIHAADMALYRAKGGGKNRVSE